MTDLAELFSRDPNQLTKTDVTELIDFYRTTRSNFNLTGTARPAKSAEPKKAVSLSNLELDL